MIVIVTAMAMAGVPGMSGRSMSMIIMGMMYVHVREHRSADGHYKGW